MSGLYSSAGVPGDWESSLPVLADPPLRRDAEAADEEGYLVEGEDALPF